MKKIKIPFIATVLTFTACMNLPHTSDREPAKQTQSAMLFVAGYQPTTSLDFYSVSQNKVIPNKFDVSTAQGLTTLAQHLDALSQYADTQKDAEKEDSKVLDQGRTLPVNFSPKGIRAGLKEMRKLTDRLQQDSLTATDKDSAKATLFELAAAISNNFRNTWQLDYQLFGLPFTAAKVLYIHSPQPDFDPAKDSKVDPAPSSFWEPKALQNIDLYSGFDRNKKSSIDSEVCDYDKAKQGWGVHAGFHLQCGSGTYKLKFGNESLSGPFNTRMYWALGYNVIGIDATTAPRVHYNRALFLEFNQRKFQNFHLKAGPVKIYEMDRQHYYDPFSFITTVRLKNGAFITADEFKSNVLKNSKVPKPELVEGNFSTQYEEQVDYLVFEKATITPKDKLIEVGSWDYDALDHPLRREIRGMQMLATWVGNFDMRWENTRLILDKSDNKSVLKHYLIDVGTGLGKASGIVKTGSRINDMLWEVTHIQKGQTEDGGPAEKIMIDGLITIQPNTTFHQMSINDGQWMIRKLSMLSDQQILQALAATQMNAAEARLALEKLLSRRNNMIRDFGLSKELAFALRSVNPKLNFDPAKEALRVRLNDGGEYIFPVTGSKVENGSVTP